uniref:Uncharacterized protein n=1 Tax=Rhizophora mucronata TaxID=61149 RepID=A0A2P2PL22_RHIMU
MYMASIEAHNKNKGKKGKLILSIKISTLQRQSSHKIE